MFAGFGVEIVVCLGMLVVARRADAQLRAAIERGTRELVEGSRSPAAPVPARVVRTRRSRRRVGGVIDQPHRRFGRLEPARVVAVLTALPAGGQPRRVGALVPSPADRELANAAVQLLHLHPTDPESAVLNVRPESRALEAARQDTRWTADLPSDLSVAGGLAGALGYGALGVAVGLAIALGVGAVA